MTAMMDRPVVFRVMPLADAREITERLMQEHGLKGWTFKFTNAKRTAGICIYRDKTIGLSRYLLAQRPYEESLNTITHEIAHALVGGMHGHDAAWQRKHRELGGDGKRCFEHTDLDAPWIGTCGHGKQFARYRRPKTLVGWRCNCRGKVRTAVEWVHNR
ncbi:SprT-like protein [Mycobacterium phage HINdeR]|uniref:SprT-like protein n=1 Tax=Mycobacterium phage HINdeR TaxID=1327770 RepID=R4JP49_9CAUD|nr:SprT-like protein [Mycobacterium phage HINdeR]AGK87556.1 SprT-like protein [Mycobacterium phage HINdeR]